MKVQVDNGRVGKPVAYYHAACWKHYLYNLKSKHSDSYQQVTICHVRTRNWPQCNGNLNYYCYVSRGVVDQYMTFTYSLVAACIYRVRANSLFDGENIVTASNTAKYTALLKRFCLKPVCWVLAKNVSVAVGPKMVEVKLRLALSLTEAVLALFWDKNLHQINYGIGSSHCTQSIKVSVYIRSVTLPWGVEAGYTQYTRPWGFLIVLS